MVTLTGSSEEVDRGVRQESRNVSDSIPSRTLSKGAMVKSIGTLINEGEDEDGVAGDDVPACFTWNWSSRGKGWRMVVLGLPRFG